MVSMADVVRKKMVQRLRVREGRSLSLQVLSRCGGGCRTCREDEAVADSDCNSRGMCFLMMERRWWLRDEGEEEARV